MASLWAFVGVTVVGAEARLAFPTIQGTVWDHVHMRDSSCGKTKQVAASYADRRGAAEAETKQEDTCTSRAIHF